MQVLFPYNLCGYGVDLDFEAGHAVGVNARVGLQVIHFVLELCLAFCSSGQRIGVNEVALLIDQADEKDGHEVSHGVPTLRWVC